MKYLISILLLAFILSNCKDEKNDQPAPEKIYFSGLTQTDNNGWPVTIDTTDWTTKDIWVKQESDLFLHIYQSNCVPSYVYQIAAYPNPCNGIFSLSFGKQPSTRGEMRLVDENFNTLFSGDSITSSFVMINASDYGIKDTVRLYYKFIENNCEFRGHGDILLK